MILDIETILLLYTVITIVIPSLEQGGLNAIITEPRTYFGAGDTFIPTSSMKKSFLAFKHR